MVQQMGRLVSFLVLIAIIVATGALFYQVMASFLLPLFLAAVLLVVFNPLQQWMVVKCKGRQRLAASLTTATVILMVLLPVVLISTLAAWEMLADDSVPDADRPPPSFRERLKFTLATMRSRYGLEMPQADTLHRLEERLREVLNETQRSPGTAWKSEEETLARLLALAEDLRVPDDVAEKRAAAEQHLKALRDNLRQAMDLDPHSLGCRELLEDAADELRGFKFDAHGNLARVYLKDLANPSERTIREFQQMVFANASPQLLSVGSAASAFVGRLLFNCTIMLVAFYFFLVDGPDMVSGLTKLLPVDERHVRELLDEFDRVSRAVVVATLLSAIAQGLLAGLGFWIAGMNFVFLLTLLAMLFGLVPFVGAGAVWVPVCFYLIFFEQRTWTGVLLTVWCIAVVSTVDNFIKPWVLRGQSNLHPLLALLSVLGGVTALGPIGILVGPIVVTFLQVLLKLLQQEMRSMDAAS